MQLLTPVLAIHAALVGAAVAAPDDNFFWLTRGTSSKCVGTNGTVVDSKPVAIDEFCATFNTTDLTAVVLAPFIHTVSGKCLGVDWMNMVVLSDCDPNDANQKWTKLTSGLVGIGAGGNCIASGYDGSVFATPCDGSQLPKSASFVLISAAKRPNSVMLRHGKFSTKCVGSASQTKKVLRVGGGCDILQFDAYDRLRDVATGYCVDVFRGEFSNGTVGLYPCHNRTNQRWTLSNTRRFLKAGESEFCLGVDWIRNSIVTVKCSAASIVYESRSSVPATNPRVFAPLYDSRLTNVDLTAAVKNGVLKNVLFGFVVDGNGSSWDGVYPITEVGSAIDGVIASVRASGGDVIPVVGGIDTELAQTNITDWDLLVAYQSLIDFYGFETLSFDLSNSLLDTQSNSRRFEIIATIIDNYPTTQIIYSLPSTPLGLSQSALDFIQQAINYNALPTILNIIPANLSNTNGLGQSVSQSAIAVRLQLQALGLSTSIGLSPTIGVIDDSNTFAIPDAQDVVSFALSTTYVNFLSFFTLNRDNALTNSTLTSSGIDQNTFDFSFAFSAFTA